MLNLIPKPKFSPQLHIDDIFISKIGWLLSQVNLQKVEWFSSFQLNNNITISSIQLKLCSILYIYKIQPIVSFSIPTPHTFCNSDQFQKNYPHFSQMFRTFTSNHSQGWSTIRNNQISKLIFDISNGLSIFYFFVFQQIIPVPHQTPEQNFTRCVLQHRLNYSL